MGTTTGWNKIRPDPAGWAYILLDHLDPAGYCGYAAEKGAAFLKEWERQKR